MFSSRVFMSNEDKRGLGGDLSSLQDQSLSYPFANEKHENNDINCLNSQFI
jgi:hypothetical protein